MLNDFINIVQAELIIEELLEHGRLTMEKILDSVASVLSDVKMMTGTGQTKFQVNFH